MSQEPLPKGVAMPRALDLFLTNRVLCAVLAVSMLTAVYWFNMLFGNLGADCVYTFVGWCVDAPCSTQFVCFGKLGWWCKV